MAQNVFFVLSVLRIVKKMHYKLQGENYMKKIAIITGAAGGIGQIFVRELTKEPLDEIWAIGRNEDKLHALKKEFGEKIIPVCKDLTRNEDILSISDLVKEENASVVWLVNNAVSYSNNIIGGVTFTRFFMPRYSCQTR